jgi:peptidoglycan/xylan/chitin deacetylase (PgdA/CDA1 family)
MRPLLLALLLLISFGAAAAESHAVVFMYHRFGEERYPSTNVRMTQFKAHLDWLAENGYHVWPLERIVEHLQQDQPIPDHTVAITIDDAYASVYRRAWPLLRERGWPVTVFVSSDSIDRRFSDYATWNQLRDMARHGARFANHGASHGHLWQRLEGEDYARWRARVQGDIRKGAARLRAELGTGFNPGLFAYPYGEYDAATAELVAELGYVAFGQHSGVVDGRLDRRGLPRFPMAEKFASLTEFANKASALTLAVDSDPPDPRATANPPVLELTLLPAALDWQRLACYEAGAPLKVEWLETGRRLRVTAPAPLPAGRARYSCTVPDGRRSRWYTQPWLIPDQKAPEVP